MLIGLTYLWIGSAFAAEQPQRTLTFEDRVKAQRAIEEVLWRHRIWPKENVAPKPTLDTVMPDSLIREKVQDYLKKSSALASLWNRPISALQLQAEMDRMGRASRDPGLLRELFSALENDPFLIAETLARQTLADRLTRAAFASDESLHRELKRKAESALAACRDVKCMKTLGVDYREVLWKLRSDKQPTRNAAKHSVGLSPEEWDEELSRLAGRFGGSPDSLPLGRLSALEERPEAFVVTAVLAQSDGELTTASVVWSKLGFDSWWLSTSGTLDSKVASVDGHLRLAAVAPDGCADDSWEDTRIGVPDPRRLHTAVWTGTEMIVWGGEYGYVGLNTGGRYNPATDTWEATSTGANVPSARFYHSAVWTGTEMVVWGGGAGYSGSAVNTGGRYSPSTDSWEPTSTGTNVPTPRTTQTAVWTGSEMIIWGGGGVPYGGSVLNSGGRYDPSTDTWSPTSTALNVPTARSRHSAIWTGTEMIVWGGGSNTGGRYNPSSDSWVVTSTGTNVRARSEHSAVWTGEEMIVWGGVYGDYLPGTGDRYNPTTDTWEPTSEINVPYSRWRHGAVWTGTEMIVWGGSKPGGGRYNPVTDTWSTVSIGETFGGTYYPTVVWTGSEMITWGGVANESFREYWYNTGGRYDPSTNTWKRTSTGPNVPAGRHDHVSVWTGTEMLVWGGSDFWSGGGGPDGTIGGRYSPSTDSWTLTSMGPNAPTTRSFATAVWTGLEMIVWGGGYDGFSSGGRYNPTTDTWATTSTGTDAPSPRTDHTAVWTGTEMIIWGGGNYSGGSSNSGGRYNPITDNWVATSFASNVPNARWRHSAIWTGTEMIVWGGAAGEASLDTGGRYNPSADTWEATATAGNVPLARSDHTAVWTGTEMIVWGGGFSTGGRFNPSTNTWLPTASGPSVSTAGNTAVWTGREMIVWSGGGADFSVAGTGGRYEPITDVWTLTSTGPFVPSGRSGHTAVWTGREMIVWGGAGGYYGNNRIATGGRYCACPDGGLFYRDADGDGWGDPAVSTSSCDGSVPVGYESNSLDCDDSVSAAFPGAPELCNNRDDDCDGTIDDGLGQSTCGVGACARTVDNCVGGQPQGCTPGQPSAEDCNGIDDDCDGTVDEEPDVDGDGYTSCATPPVDCNDADATIHPGAAEICDGVDNDCNEKSDEGCSAVCSTQTPESISWWTGDGSAIDVLGSNPGVLENGATFASGVVSSGFDLDGIDDFVRVPNHPSLNPATLTVDAWIRPRALPSGDIMAIVNKGDFSYRLQIEGRAGFPPGVTWALYCAGWVDVFSGFQPPTNSWTHVAGTYDGTVAKVYVNGSLSNTVAVGCMNATSQDLAIGENLDFPARPNFNGVIDEVHLYGRALSETELLSIYRAGTHGVCKCVDSDADGFHLELGCGTALDCDDSNAAVNPDALETCDGYDNNCDGSVDEDAAGVDSDADMVRNACDNCRFVANTTQIDGDADLVGNACDNCINTANPNQFDADTDGRGDTCDNCPTVPNGFQDDSDADRAGDACDNCSLDPNPSQTDFDHDGQGDMCDINDGLIYVYSTDKNYREWQPESGFTTWNSYRGSLDALRETGQYAQIPGSTPLAARDCGLSDPWALDLDVPAPGEVAFNLVTGVAGGIESGLGTNSAGVPRANVNPCP